MTLRKPKSSMLAILANAQNTNTTVGPAGSIKWNYESNTLHIYDGVTAGGHLLTFEVESSGGVAGESSTWLQGETYGYASGGNPYTKAIDRYSIVSDGNSTTIGNLSTARDAHGGFSSSTDAYIAGGRGPTMPGAGNNIEKFPFTGDSGVSGSSVGTLAAARAWVGSTGNSSYGYIASGYAPPTVPTSDDIQKFPYASEGSGSLIGNLTRNNWGGGSFSDGDNGYYAGGFPTSTTIDSWPLASDGNASGIGSLHPSYFGNYIVGGHQSSEHGFISGGFPSGAIVQKWPFSSQGTATAFTGMSTTTYGHHSTSSTTHGYVAGGHPPSTNIQKFSFTTDTTSGSVGNLTTPARLYKSGGNQV